MIPKGSVISNSIYHRGCDKAVKSEIELCWNRGKPVNADVFRACSEFRNQNFEHVSHDDVGYPKRNGYHEHNDVCWKKHD